MSRKDYRLIAAALREARDRMETPEHENAWRVTARLVADALSDESGYDLNGNRRFDRDRFYAAAGYER